MLVSKLRQRLAILTVLVRAIGVHAALFLLLILVVGCGGQSSTTDKEEKAKQQTTTESSPKSEPTPETGSSKRAVAIEEGSLRDLFQERVGGFRLQGVEDVKREPDFRRLNPVEALAARYVGPGGAELEHILFTARSPEAADDMRRKLKLLLGGGDDLEEGCDPEEGCVDERAIEAGGKRVGTVTVIQGKLEQDDGTIMLWNNGSLVAIAAMEGENDAAESFYESVPY